MINEQCEMIIEKYLFGGKSKKIVILNTEIISAKSIH
jgi:hypothetical protein